MIEQRDLIHNMQQQSKQYVDPASMKMGTMKGQIDKKEFN